VAVLDSCRHRGRGGGATRGKATIFSLLSFFFHHGATTQLRNGLDCWWIKKILGKVDSRGGSLGDSRTSGKGSALGLN